ncbi:protein-tyrosine-phosphatase [Antarcticibacterium arcticum]|uniref:Protein-tyrosine-phosphatase n=1 Tax=Antarcticibacterium arcticum TaxID=2585771 RepID=A0A5B8YFX1_9FLAO|nr:protein-tyrosine-phosphatase [Antarcticibacterium arcticum]QED36654.1 protein-tyrosine-phosphatase [Antarcticibacterium arcticum]
MTRKTSELFEKVDKNITALKLDSIPKERKKLLQSLVAYIQEKITKGQPVRLNFICTHNSRRSHLSQVWAQALAAYYNIPNIFCYSGGTEATALFPVAAETLEEHGFEIAKLSEEKNPVYSIKFGENEHPVIGFSKTFDDNFNPKSGFAAIMTCSQADAGCPFIAGAEKRIPVTYEDPKEFDGTGQQKQKYKERSEQIATELKYVFSEIKVK